MWDQYPRGVNYTLEKGEVGFPKKRVVRENHCKKTGLLAGGPLLSSQQIKAQSTS
jgi:hypothetical protein